jgi:hypothetical protein
LSSETAEQAKHPNLNKERVNVGTELALFYQIFARGGYGYNYDDEDFTVGMGVAILIEGVRLVFDYAWAKKWLPNVHRLSVGVTF